MNQCGYIQCANNLLALFFFVTTISHSLNHFYFIFWCKPLECVRSMRASLLYKWRTETYASVLNGRRLEIKLITILTGTQQRTATIIIVIVVVSVGENGRAGNTNVRDIVYSTGIPMIMQSIMHDVWCVGNINIASLTRIWTGECSCVGLLRFWKVSVL